MDRLDPLVGEVETALVSHGICPDSVLMAAKADLSPDGLFVDTWVVGLVGHSGAGKSTLDPPV